MALKVIAVDVLNGDTKIPSMYSIINDLGRKKQQSASSKNNKTGKADKKKEGTYEKG